MRFLVLDEADEMLNMGFATTSRRFCPTPLADKQNVALFSATMPPGTIRRLSKKYLNDPVEMMVKRRPRPRPTQAATIWWSHTRRRSTR